MQVTKTGSHKESLSLFAEHQKHTKHHQVNPSKLTRSSHTLHSTDNALDPRELTRVLANCTLDFLAVLISPDAIFLRGMTVEVRICPS